MKRPLLLIALAILLFAPAITYAQSAFTVTGLYRLYSPAVGEHFYTVDSNEAFALDRSGLYRLEGVEGNVYQQPFDGTVPLYRLYNKKANRHFYSTSAQELNQVINQGFVLEGIIGYMAFSTYNPNGMSPHNFHRLYSPNANDHFYTSNDDEMLALERGGTYLREGDMGYIYK
jgi:hypothetical protein